MSVKSHYRTAKRNLNKHVKVQTRYGTVFYGKIVRVSATKIYLKVSSVKSDKKVHTSFAPFLLPLILFDLLAIVLITTPRRRRIF
ncbi:hypothetical protein UB51_20810 [Paenibacillus sp. IHBB 10380]|nr:hypothetical protein UB51_20810 [Paenibacillus sp. IHBB 10380]